MTTLLITGGRDFCESVTTAGIERDRETYMAERVALGFALDMIGPSKVYVGDADGTDRWAIIWCDRRGVPYERFVADWTRQGKRAGPIRNQDMIDRKPDMGCAFPGDRGTADCTRRMERAGIPIHRVEITERAS